MLIYVQYFGCLGSICISTPRPVEMRGYFPHTTPTQVKLCEQTSFMKWWFPSPFWQFKFKPNYSTFFGLEDLVSAFAIILLYSSRAISIFCVKLSIRARDKDLGSRSEDKISDQNLSHRYCHDKKCYSWSSYVRIELKNKWVPVFLNRILIYMW